MRPQTARKFSLQGLETRERTVKGVGAQERRVIFPISWATASYCFFTPGEERPHMMLGEAVLYSKSRRDRTALR